MSGDLARQAPQTRQARQARQARQPSQARPTPGQCRARALPVRRRGFTLLEVLVALAIVAIALAAGLRAAGVLTDNAGRLADVTAAQWCADNQLTALRLARAFPGVGESEFKCEQLGRSYNGQLVTRPTPNPNFRRVDAVMTDETGRVLVSISTVLGRL